MSASYPPTHRIERERGTWPRWDPEHHRTVISHPYLWFVYEDEQVVSCHDTKAAANAWIEAQS